MPTSSSMLLPHLWQNADLMIKFVALLLLAMSMATWTVFIYRCVQSWKVQRTIPAVGKFWDSSTIESGMQALGQSTWRSPFFRLAEDGLFAAHHHAEHRTALHGQLSLAEWVEDGLQGSIDQSIERMQLGLPLLASVGSTAPFVGLLGTVWGIYHALTSIGTSGGASLDKIAGPIGETLIMTALGLLVAIPAVLAYNLIQRSNRRLLAQLTRFSRQLHGYLLTGSPFKGNLG
jgi:biopolymer transport protein ExbB